MVTQLEINEITAIYEDILFRAPDPAGLNFWAGVLDRGLVDLQGIISAFTTTTEALTIVDPIIRLYDGLFGRVPEMSGLQNWVSAEEHGESFDSIVQYFVSSQEFANDYNAGVLGTIPAADGPLFISELYEHLLGRNYDAAGLAYWEGILGSTPTVASEAKVVEGFINSAEFIKDTQNGIISWETTGVLSALANTTSTTVGTPTYPTTIVNTGLIQNLTTGNDTINAGVTVDGSLTNSNGIVPTLTSEDIVANVTNLNLTDAYGNGTDLLPAFLPGYGLSNIWNLTLTTDGNAGDYYDTGAWFNTTGVSNLRSVTVTSYGSSIDMVQAASTTNVLVTHNDSGGGYDSSDSSYSSYGGGVEVIGGKNVTVINNGGWGVVVGNDSDGGVPINSDLPSGAVTVTQNAALFGDVQIFGGTNVTVTATSDSYEGNIDIGNTGNNTGNFVSGGDVDPTGAIVVTDAAEWGGDETVANGNGSDGPEGNITIYGGSSVTVTAAGDFIQVGDPTGNTASNNTTGDVTITDTAPFVWGDPEQGGQEEDVNVVGGDNILVTTNTGDVTIGDYYEELNATLTGALAGTQPTGTVTVFDSAIESTASSPPPSPPISGDSDSDCCCATWTGAVSCVYVDIYGGTNVNVTTTDAFIYIGAIAENSSYDYVVNSAGDYVVLAPTGNITINDGTAEGYTSTALGSLGSTTAEANIYVLGGAIINITTDVGNVTVGTCVLNPDGTPIAGAEPTGTVTVTDDSAFSGSTVKIYGGTGVTVNAAGAQVDIGKIVWNDGTGTVVAPSGTTTVDGNGDAIVVNDVSTTNVYDNIINTCAADVTIIGSFDGNSVSVTTNVGGVYIGSDCDVSGANPTGDVTVVDNATGLWVNPCFQSIDCTPYVWVIGGANVTITVNDASIEVGDDGAPGTNPTGLVDITVNGIQTANQYDNIIDVAGAGDGVTINVTGVADYGCEQPAIQVGTATSIDTDSSDTTFGVVTLGTPVVGPVQITDTHSGWNYGSEDIIVIGGTGADGNGFAVDIAVGLVACSTIWVGDCPTTNLAGSAYINIGDYTTGNVSISQVGVSNGSTVYGDAYDDVYMNGGNLVVLTGGDGATIVDVNSLQIPNSPDAGDFVGTSTLTTVTLDGVSGDICITANALSTLNIYDNVCDPDIYITNTAPASSPLTITVSNETLAYVEDDGPNGGAYSGTLTIVSSTSNGTAANEVGVSFGNVTKLAVNATAGIEVDDYNLPALTSITVTGTGAVDLWNVESSSLLKSIDATGSSGGVTVEINGEQTSFSGGSGPNDVTVDSANAITAGPPAVAIAAINGGTGGSNEVELTNVAVDYVALDTDPLLSSGSPAGPFTGFSILGLDGATDFGPGVSGQYNVSGFSNVDINTTTGLDLTNAGATETLTFNYDGNVTWDLNTNATHNAVGIILNDVDATVVTEAADTNAVQEVDITSNAGDNTLNLSSVGTGTITIDITGAGNLTLNDTADGTVTTVNASSSTGNIDLYGVAFSAGDTVGGANSVTGGAGFLEVSMDDANTVVGSVDGVTVGTGGGLVTVGGGGAGAFNFTTGGETVTLSTSATAGYTAIFVPDLPVPGDLSDGARATINNFVMGGASPDIIVLTDGFGGQSPTPTQQETDTLTADEAADHIIGLTITSGAPSANPASPVTVSYSTTGTDTAATEATGLANAINTNATLEAAGITATVSGGSVLINSPTTEQITFATEGSGAGDETLSNSGTPAALTYNEQGVLTINATGTAGTDTVGVTFTSADGATGTPFTVTYTVPVGDVNNTTDAEAAGLAAAINASSKAVTIGISAVAEGNEVVLLSPASDKITYAAAGTLTAGFDEVVGSNPVNTPVILKNGTWNPPGHTITYTSVDGVLTTTGTASISDAVAIVDSQGVGTIAMVTVAGSTYLVENNGGTLNTNETDTANAAPDTILLLNGLGGTTAVDGFAWAGPEALAQYAGIGGAGQSVTIAASDPSETWQLVTDFTNTGSLVASNIAYTYYETADHAAPSASDVGGAFAGTVLLNSATGVTIQYVDVANWGFMDVGGTANVNTNAVTGGNVEVSQVGATAEFALVANNGGFMLDGFTYDNGATGGTLIIDPLDGSITLGQLTDAGSLLVITGSDDVTIGTAASTGFTFGASNGTFIDAQTFNGDLHLGTEALPVTGGDLTIDVTDGYFGSFDSYVGGGATIFAKGDGDIINVGNVDSVTMPWNTEETGSVVIQAGGQGDTISVNIDCSGPGPGAIVGAAGNGDYLTLVGGYGVNVPLFYPEDDTVVLGVISAAGNKDSAYDLATDTLINVDVSGSGVNCDLAVPLGSQDVSLGTGDVIQIGDPSGNNGDTTAIAWLGGDNTVTIGYGAPADGSSLGADGTITADIWVSGAGDETGATISNTATDLSGITHETISWDGCANLNLFFFNEANESLAGCTWANSVVNVSTVNAPTLGAALNIAATQAAVLDQNFADGANTSTAGGTLAIDHSTGLIDWFQYGGNTYIVEANNNSTTAAAAHTALGSHDVVIELIGLVNPGDIGINHAYGNAI